MGLDIYLYKVTDKNEEFHQFEGNALLQASKTLSMPLVEVEEEYVNWEKTFQNRGLKVNEYDWAMTNSDGVHFSPKKKSVENSKTEYVVFHGDDKDIATYPKTIKGAYVEEIGYQRKGMNAWSSVLPECIDDDGTMSVFEKAKVEKLLPYVDDYSKENFKSFIDNFEDGKTFLWFWW